MFCILPLLDLEIRIAHVRRIVVRSVCSWIRSAQIMSPDPDPSTSRRFFCICTCHDRSLGQTLSPVSTTSVPPCQTRPMVHGCREPFIGGAPTKSNGPGNSSRGYGDNHSIILGSFINLRKTGLKVSTKQARCTGPIYVLGIVVQDIVRSPDSI